MNMLKKLSLVPTGLRYKLLIAFSLMSVIPLLVCGYFIRDLLFPPGEDIFSVGIILFLTIAIACLGFLLAKRIVEPIVEMAIAAQIIASGNYDKKIRIETEDEIGELGSAINRIAGRIKSSMEELRSYSDKTRAIDTDIHKRLTILSSILQVSDYISAALQLEDILALIVDKVRQIAESCYVMLLTPGREGDNILNVRVGRGVPTDQLARMSVVLGKGLLGKYAEDDKIVRADAASFPSHEARAFMDEFGVKAFSAVPVSAGGDTHVMLFVGSVSSDYSFSDEDMEMLRVFAKQAALAFENDRLMRKTKELSIRDDLTGLFNGRYMRSLLEDEIKRSVYFQRPCSYIFLRVDDFTRFRDNHSELETENVLKQIAVLLRESVSEVGKAGRAGDDSFALLLPETNKREACKIADETRRKIGSARIGVVGEAVTVSGTVAENPIDGMSADELIEKTSTALKQARDKADAII